MPAWAAINLVNSANSSTTSSQTINPDTAGNLLAVGCICSSQCTGVTDNASGGTNSYSEVVGSRATYTSGSPFPQSVWYSQIVFGGATSVTCDGSGAEIVAVYEYSGISPGNPVDTSSGTTDAVCSGTACPGPPITTTNAGDVIFGFTDPGQSISSVNSPWGNFIENSTTGFGSADYFPSTIVTSNQAGWVDAASGDSYASSAVAFLPPAIHVQWSITGGKVKIQ